MTIRELIAELQKFDIDCEIELADGGWIVVDSYIINDGNKERTVVVITDN